MMVFIFQDGSVCMVHGLVSGFPMIIANLLTIGYLLFVLSLFVGRFSLLTGNSTGLHGLSWEKLIC